MNETQVDSSYTMILPHVLFDFLKDLVDVGGEHKPVTYPMTSDVTYRVTQLAAKRFINYTVSDGRYVVRSYARRSDLRNILIGRNRDGRRDHLSATFRKRSFFERLLGRAA